MLKKILVVLVLVGLAVVADHEWLRYKESFAQCDRQRYSDESLIGSPHCRDLVTRDAACAAAEERTILTVPECARNQWRRRGWWNEFLVDYWAVYYVAVPLAGLGLYLVLGHVFEERREARYLEKQSEFVDKFLTGNPFQIQHKSARGKRRRTGDEEKRIEWSYA
jgi:hypothetical protein